MKVTLITGASSGIGEAFARRLASDGHDLLLVARSEEKLRQICEELTASHKILARYVAVDLTEHGSDERVYLETQKLGCEVEWLINNAGIGSMGDFVKLGREKELDIVRLNILSLVALTHRFLQPMRQRRSGTIINVSSAAGFQPIPFFATYAASKAFVTSFTEAIAEENAPFGIRILALCPGSTQTNFFNAAEIDRPIQVKGQQTPEQVVETALSALKSGRRKVVSGWANYLGALAGAYAPNAVATRLMGRVLRQKYQPKD